MIMESSMDRAGITGFDGRLVQSAKSRTNGAI